MDRKERAKNSDMVAVLSSFGHDIVKKSGGRAWYLSPFRHENAPSFVVNLNRNTWRDFGIGQGGDTIDFVIESEKCSFFEAIDLILGDERKVIQHDKTKAPLKESGIDVIDVKPLSNIYLISYAQSRGISEAVLKEHCQEVSFVFKGWEHIENTAIGFKNTKDGWELRSQSKKVGTSPKHWSMIRGESSGSCDVFEGFFDFLSHLQYHGMTKPLNDSFVLNSTVFAEWVKPELELYDSVNLYMDNDQPAQDKINEFFTGSRYNDCREVYSNFGDYNEFVMNQLLTEK